MTVSRLLAAARRARRGARLKRGLALHYDCCMGLTIDKILVILVIAMFVLGPERLPMYAKKLGDLVRSVKRMADGAKDRLRDEMGPEFDEVDWKQLDPRQYDPRRIIRDALLEDEKEAQAEARRTRAAQASQTRRIGGGPVTADAAGAAAVGAAATIGASALAAGAAPETGAEAGAEPGAEPVAADDASTPGGTPNGAPSGGFNFDEEAT